MKMIGKYAEMGISTKEEAFSYFILHLRETIYTYDFFVAWDKVLGNVANVEVTLNILNSLIGKENIETELKKLIKSYPEIVTVIPLLLAVHKNIIKINEWGGDVEYCFSRRRDLSDEEIEKTVYFASQWSIEDTVKQEY